MKRKAFIALTLLLFAATAGAQSKLSPAARVMMARIQSEPASRNAATPRTNAIIKLTPGANIADIEATPGLVVLATRANLAIVNIPVDQAASLVSTPAVAALDMGTKASPVMDLARPASKVQEVIFGEKNGLPANYRGTGVLVGMMDQGFDPNHINFYDKDTTQTRIVRFSTITGPKSALTTYDTPSAIRNFTTDNASSTHATHVAGIMTGAYNKNLLSGKIEGDKGVTVNYTNSPFYGVASAATIYPCVGDLYTANLTLAAETFAAYAKTAGLPGVFNLSVGITTGPHDGTSLFNQYIAEIGKDIIVSVAAGNDGDSDVSLQHNFSAASSKVATTLAPDKDGTFSGTIDAWSQDSRTFQAQFAIINKNTGAVIWKCDIPVNTGDGAVYIANSKSTVQGTTSNVNFDSSFSDESAAWFTANVDPENNRYEVYADFDLTPRSTSQALVPAVIFNSSEQIRMDAFAFGSVFTDKLDGQPVPGLTAGNPDFSISDLACGANILVVGAYKTRNLWATLDGTAMWYGKDATPVGDVCSFTSYGTLPDGRKLPEFCAPGEGIISSYSKYYVDSYSAQAKNFLTGNKAATSINVNRGTRNNYFGLLQGTSMACPYIAGSAALLLEANNALTVAQIKEAITKTAIKLPADTKETRQWGAGQADIFNALRHLLGMSTDIGNTLADTDRRCSLDITPGAITVTVAGEKAFTASLHTIAGASAAKASAAGDQLTINTSALRAGVYILTVETPAGEKITRKIVLN